MPSPGEAPAPMSSSVRGPLSDNEMGIAGGVLAHAVHRSQQQQFAMRIMRSIGGKSLSVAAGCFMDGVHSGQYGAHVWRIQTSAWWWVRMGPFYREPSWGWQPHHCILMPMPWIPVPADAEWQPCSWNSDAWWQHGLHSPQWGRISKCLFLLILLPVEEWSRTVIKLPKVAKLNLTYAEFIIKAEGDTDLSQYGEFMLANFGPYAKTQKAKSHTQGVDFAHFLVRVKFNGSGITQGTFPPRAPKLSPKMCSQLSDDGDLWGWNERAFGMFCTLSDRGRVNLRRCLATFQWVTFSWMYPRGCLGPKGPWCQTSWHWTKHVVWSHRLGIWALRDWLWGYPSHFHLKVVYWLLGHPLPCSDSWIGYLLPQMYIYIYDMGSFFLVPIQERWADRRDAHSSTDTESEASTLGLTRCLGGTLMEQPVLQD